MLTLEAVSKIYNHRKQVVTALKNVTVKIDKADFVSVVGPSGSGKSTLLTILGGMLTPSEGIVLLEGQSLYEMTPNERAKIRRENIGFLFQTFNLIPYLSAIENVQVPLFLAGNSKNGHVEKASSLLERVGLGDRLNHKPSELSIGQQQRVALARMLVNDPNVILADEPTGNLDPETSQEVIDFLCGINKEGKTIVMVTHDPNAAMKTNKVLKLVAGEINPQGNRDGGSNA